MCELGAHLCPACGVEVPCDLPKCADGQYCDTQCQACDYWEEEQHKEYEREQYARWEEEQRYKDLIDWER